jgi:hypothetical protein
MGWGQTKMILPHELTIKKASAPAGAEALNLVARRERFELPAF